MSVRAPRRLAAAGLACALAAAGCSQNYAGERYFWKAQQLAAPILKAPDQASAAQIESAIDAFERVIDKARGTVWAARAQASIGSLHALKKDYDKARQAYTLLLQNYSSYRDLALTARAALAKTYELEDRWEDAVKEYQELADRHQWTRLGMEAPLYIAAAYEKRGDAELAKRAYERAIRTYTLMIPDAPNPVMGSQVRGYLVSAYQRSGDWDKAIATLNELLAAPNGVNRPMVLLTLGTIYQTKLNAPDQAVEVYTRLLEEFPEHPLGRIAKSQLNALQPGSLPDEPGPLPTEPAAP